MIKVRALEKSHSASVHMSMCSSYKDMELCLCVVCTGIYNFMEEFIGHTVDFMAALYCSHTDTNMDTRRAFHT